MVVTVPFAHCCCSCLLQWGWSGVGEVGVGCEVSSTHTHTHPHTHAHIHTLTHTLTHTHTHSLAPQSPMHTLHCRTCHEPCLSILTFLIGWGHQVVDSVSADGAGLDTTAVAQSMLNLLARILQNSLERAASTVAGDSRRELAATSTTRSAARTLLWGMRDVRACVRCVCCFFGE